MADSDIEEMKKDIKAILHIINGNGKVGMAAKVELLWSARQKVLGSLVTIMVGVIIAAIKVWFF